jgi:hypothetical protein
MAAITAPGRMLPWNANASPKIVRKKAMKILKIRNELAVENGICFSAP